MIIGYILSRCVTVHRMIKYSNCTASLSNAAINNDLFQIILKRHVSFITIKHAYFIT